jgi:hypothetical protein
MKPKTHTVVTAYVGRDGKQRVYVKDHASPLLTDELLVEGDAVRIDKDRAVRA